MSFIGASLFVGISVSVCAGCASTSTSGSIDIRRQPIDEALIAWADQTEYNIIAPVCPATRRPSRHVRGTDAIDALEELLAGAKLRYEFINARTVAIRCHD